MSFKDRFLRQRRPTLYNIPGFAGGNLGDELDQQPENPPTRQVLTPTNQQNITRPRQVNLFQQRLMQQPDTPVDFREPGSPPVSMSRERRTQPRDYVADDSAYLHELQNKPLSWRDKAGMVSQVVSQSLGGKPLPTRRERALAEAEGQLGQDLALEKQKILSEQGQMVPFQLPDGTWTQVPAKSIGTLASRQQGQQGTLSLRRQQMDAHNKRWETMGKHEAAQDAQRLYNSGAADDNEDLRDEIATRMGLPAGTKLPPSTQGQVSVDDNGNYILINRRRGTATPVTQSEKPVASMQSTLEAGRNRRAAAAQAGANQRAGMRQSGGMTLPQKAAAERLVARYNLIRKQEMSTAIPAKEKIGLTAQREALGNQIYATYPGMFEETEGGEIRAKAQGAEPSAPGSNVTEQQIRDAAKAKGLDPDTAVERARRRGLIQ